MLSGRRGQHKIDRSKDRWSPQGHGPEQRMPGWVFVSMGSFGRCVQGVPDREWLGASTLTTSDHNGCVCAGGYGHGEKQLGWAAISREESVEVANHHS